ncbi:helix-turn-helix transcriptional regulator [Candidatus Sulfurimonas baltica]|uniref:DNA-binding protein n=1 Tax=Candidatus Sulfurimonas baltica TaxID=2740404 RepID=A0A7S7RP22_9BACT|nr:hypothetical protein [Candidatus Sulfurimonas baltica]QOY53038.1 hypothetical protein HUE88_04975 [Candidatus Sulfurimonas baltica]
MDNENKIIEMLEKEYKAFLLSKKQVAKIMGISLSSVDNLLSSDSNKLPEYIKMGDGLKSSIRFSVVCVAKFLSRSNEA